MHLRDVMGSVLPVDVYRVMLPELRVRPGHLLGIRETGICVPLNGDNLCGVAGCSAISRASFQSMRCLLVRPHTSGMHHDATDLGHADEINRATVMQVLNSVISLF